MGHSLELLGNNVNRYMGFGASQYPMARRRQVVDTATEIVFDVFGSSCSGDHVCMGI